MSADASEGAACNLQVIDVRVELPSRRAVASLAASRRKPMASVSFSLSDGAERTIKVPVRVARILRDESLPLPMDVDDAFDAVHALEGRVCLTMLTEMLGRRDHGAEEARMKLLDYGFRPQEADGAVSRARELRFLDDDRFCSYFIEERKRRGWGRRKIEIELKRKGIEASEVPGWPDAFFSDDDDRERARVLLARKVIPDRNPYEKLLRFLVSKGFSYGIASDIVKERLGS